MLAASLAGAGCGSSGMTNDLIEVSTEKTARVETVPVSSTTRLSFKVQYVSDNGVTLNASTRGSFELDTKVFTLDKTDGRTKSQSFTTKIVRKGDSKECIIDFLMDKQDGSKRRSLKVQVE